MLAKAKTSLLTPADVAKLRFEPFAEGHDLAVQPQWAGFKIPYFDLKGKPDGFYRFRYTQSQPSKGWGALTEEPKKPRRYSQPADTDCGVYLPPNLELPWPEVAKNVKTPLVITEGELKAACACKLHTPTIGLGGVYSWRSARKHHELLPILEEFHWKSRIVIICFDSDITTNAMVKLAASRLAAVLAMRGAAVRWATLPPPTTTVDGAPPKQGLDDYAYSFPTLEEAEVALEALLDKAEDVGPGAPLLRMNMDVAIIRSTGEVVELNTGNVYSASAFSDVVYKAHTFSEWRASAAEGGKPKEVKKATAKEWLSWPLRSEVERLEYAPECDRTMTPDGGYNTWAVQGWACTPNLTPNPKRSTAQPTKRPQPTQSQSLPPDPTPTSLDPWNELFALIFGALTPAMQLWARQWLAYPLQHPGVKLATAMLVWGRQQGTGKTKIGDTMRSIYGRNYGTVTNAQLSGQFNEWAQDKQFIVGDEITLGDKRGIANSLKDMITRTTLRMNIKNRKTYAVRDCINYFFTSNHEDAIYLENDDRRIFVCHADVQPLPQAFYSSYQRWLDKDGGASRLFHYLLHEVDCSTFDPQGRAPVTAAKLDMAASGRGDAEDWAFQLASDPDAVLPPDRYPWSLWRTQDLLERYDPEHKERIKAIGLGRALASAGLLRVAGGSNSVRIAGVRARLWAVRSPERFKRMGMADAVRFYESERPAHHAVGSSEKFKGRLQ